MLRFCPGGFVEDFVGDEIMNSPSAVCFPGKGEKMTNPRKRSSWGPILILLLIFIGCKKSDQADSKAAPDLTKQTQAYLTIGETIVRSGPGPQFKAIGRIRGNTQIDVVGRDGEWLLIVSKHGNPPGYIDARNASPSPKETQAPPIKAAGDYVAVSDTELRKGPGLEYPVVTKVREGMKLNVVGVERGWLRIESKHGRAPGYMDPTYARKSTDQ